MARYIALPVIAPPLVPCTQCGKCCTYVAVGINAPTTARYATDILWYLYHENVSVYVDGDGDWSVQFDTRCRHLQDDLLCGIYEQRPHICRAFDETACEVNAPDGGRSFRTPDEFAAYLKAKRPRLWSRLRASFVPKAEARP